MRASPSTHPLPPSSSHSPDSLIHGGSIAQSAEITDGTESSNMGGKGKATASRPRKRFVGKNSMGAPTNGAPSSSSRSVPHSSIPPDILHDPLLAEAITQNLPNNYNFEVHKTIWNIRKWDCKMVALQMPEGLLMWGCVLSDIVERFTSAQAVILGDVTYGACCIDDYTAIALGCDMLVHYGHSCLVPIDTTSIRTLYVFVEISIDSDHLAKTIRRNFPSNREAFLRDAVHATALETEGGADVPVGTVAPQQKRAQGRVPVVKSQVELEGRDHEPTRAPAHPTRTRLALVSTIQFAASLNRLKEDLSVEIGEDTTFAQQLLRPSAHDPSAIVPRSSSQSDSGKYEVTVPRSKPLSPGEILGCTAPRLNDVDAILYLADGRFHLEAIMIANPSVPAFRYDPYSKRLTREWYDHEEMRSIRGKAVMDAKATLLPADNLSSVQGGPTVGSSLQEGQVWGVVLGTLGRQGSLLQMEAILRQLEAYKIASIPYMPILLSELSPAKLALFNDPDVGRENVVTFIQTSCPRLSIDWGYAFDKPLLSPYEAAVVLGLAKSWEEEESHSAAECSTKRARKLQTAYPMDFYEAGSVWASSRIKGRETAWPVDVPAH